MSDSTGGSAFPRPAAWSPNGTIVSAVREGMTLRDYFAAKTLEALIAREPIVGNVEDDGSPVWSEDSPTDDDGSFMAFATRAYFFADAMLKARLK